MIVEGIITTRDAGGAVNFAPMGLEWGEERLVLKPFLETTTFRNVTASGCAVFNLVDDVLLFAQAAIGSPQFPWRPAERVAGAVLEAACSWYELEVETRRRHPAPLPHRHAGRPSRARARVHRVQPGEARGARGGHPRHPGPHAPGRTDKGGPRPARGPGGEDRRSPGTGSVGPAAPVRGGASLSGHPSE